MLWVIQPKRQSGIEKIDPMAQKLRDKVNFDLEQRWIAKEPPGIGLPYASGLLSGNTTCF